MARQGATDAQEFKHLAAINPFFKPVDQADIQQARQFDITRHIDPVEFGQCIVTTAVKQTTQFDFLAPIYLEIIAFNRHYSGLTNTGTLTNYGVAVNNDTVDIYEGTLTNYSTFFNHNDMTNYGTLANDVYFEASGALINNGTLTNQPGGTLTNNGTIDTTNGTFTNNGTLNGDGKIIGNHSDYGVTSPGNSAGVMTIEGDYFKVDGSKEIELGGLFDGGGDNALAEFDRIDVTGNVELAGLLNVSLIDGFEKRINRGQVFEFLRVGGTLSGQYDGLGEGALVGNFGGQDLFITYGGMGDGGGVALYTNAVPEPTTVLIWSMLAGLGMTVRRRR